MEEETEGLSLIYYCTDSFSFFSPQSLGTLSPYSQVKVLSLIYFKSRGRPIIIWLIISADIKQFYGYRYRSFSKWFADKII